MLDVTIGGYICNIDTFRLELSTWCLGITPHTHIQITLATKSLLFIWIKFSSNLFLKLRVISRLLFLLYQKLKSAPIVIMSMIILDSEKYSRNPDCA